MYYESYEITHCKCNFFTAVANVIITILLLLILLLVVLSLPTPCDYYNDNNNIYDNNYHKYLLLASFSRSVRQVKRAGHENNEGKNEDL